ncbi:TRAP transporter large permease subunit [Reyranella sp.]|jgi:tripartite ATP-independent transporter DctM subunit|uniref:TRAP transporter large permease n=1 Tax=Reyranella sp. TaxID=1929291 RepID=UPI000BD2566F|nr:TRAP transporter large permease subunit [Reyranella sp.]OYY39513.1 MAG: C4-dicarboxylate ABC transporter permease [Rhodospirillales bacterium 35-66-84]OYZ92920.1 MAG: C4-dicarboxylate ABC transporter permease [Rhodospirillales bacterium 24-66-33]OZB24359.1 MAG: C4-dicarboxylate ABC transporter permease [Rhodospirillales bacterium 39-66-50]HQS14577.1 TRAP transporter large permease subunit [Reyranella sp.]HQT12509.1 TRAP transporter large permease subunit [Reyranella sp.]
MLEIVLTMFVVLFAFLAGGLWIGWTLAVTGTVLLAIFRDIPLDKLLAQYTWNILTTQELLALPLFIIMGEILFRTRLSQTLFRGLSPWAAMLPGRLLHVNVIGCTIFAAISGSSAATTQVVGRISLTELLKRGYSKDVAVGSLAGAGTLGFLIPPSNIMIIYGVLGDVSIAKLFTAGFIPGALLAACFMGWIMIYTTLKPELVPAAERKVRIATAAEFLTSIRELGPAVFLILCVLGSMYGGFATPSEAAAVGVLGALLVAGAQRELSLPALRAIAIGSVQTCAMIALIVLGASILGSAAAFLGIPAAVAEFVSSLGLSSFMLIVALIVFYLILGCFLDGFSMIVMTLPIVMPIVKGAGFDPIWFGVFLVLVVEMAQITPPVGFNLFVIQGLTDDGLGYIARVTLPFLSIMVFFTMLLALFPDIALWLPRYLSS